MRMIYKDFSDTIISVNTEKVMRDMIGQIKKYFLKKKTLKQANALREKLKKDHGKSFDTIRQKALKKETSSVPIDRNKNVSTILKFMEGRASGDTKDPFAKKVQDLLDNSS